jgi:hypothetical protein
MSGDDWSYGFACDAGGDGDEVLRRLRSRPVSPAVAELDYVQLKKATQTIKLKR